MDGLMALWETVSALREELGSEASLGEIITLLAIARAEARGETIEPKELVAITKTPATSISRHTLFLGSVKRSRKPGLGLISQTLSATDRRRRPITLTPEGRRTVKKLVNRFQKLVAHK